jgi:polyhydroxyalkanoate synthesis regulator phasin
MATLKDTLVSQGLKLMSDPRVTKWMQDERVMRAVMKAAGLPAKVQSFTAEQLDRMVKAMDLAKEDEVNDLRRAVRRLEDEVARMRREGGGKPPAGTG